MAKLSRQQLRDVSLARGVSMDDLVARTGVPMASLMAMMAGDGEKEARLLLSQETYGRILHLLGVSADGSGLAAKQVRLWVCPEKNFAAWQAAFTSIKKTLLSDNASIVLAEIVAGGTLFARKRRIVLLHDELSQASIVIAGVPDKFSAELQKIFGTPYAHSTKMSPSDYSRFLKLVDNNACSHAQFIGMLGGGTLRYSWADVKAAAQQFNLQPDDLILMISDRVHAAAPASASASTPTATSVSQEPKLSLVVDGTPLPAGVTPAPADAVEGVPTLAPHLLFGGQRVAAM